jgi:hypothetical protein
MGPRNLLVLVVILVLLVLLLPTWPYSAGWGYFPSGLLGVILLVVLLLVVLKKM